MSFDLVTLLFVFISIIGAVGMFLARPKPPRPDPSPESADDDSRERGSIFIALFGAVALVGILGSATFAFMNGPLRSSVFLTQRNIASTQMNIAAQMAVAAAAAQGNGGDCDGDGVVEPLPWRLSSGGDAVPPTGGGFIPMLIGTSKSDPWGSPYGYCVWDHGSKIGDIACGGPSQKRRSGAASDGFATVAIISSGPDKAFQTTCNDFADTSPADGQPDMDLVAKAAGSDDLTTVYTYLEAVGASSGLWQIKSGSANTATIGSKDIEVGGDASFAGQVITDSLNSRTGLLAVNDPLRLPDEVAFPTCTAALVGAVRRYNGNVQMCGPDTAPGTYAFKALGGSGGAATLDDLSDVATDYASKYNMFLGQQSGATNTGSGGTALGVGALVSNTTGNHNTAVGRNALNKTTTGYNNTSIGTQSLFNNTSGVWNTALGVSAMSSVTSAYYNTAAGGMALYSGTTGGNNVALGYQALYANTAGSSNTAVGYQALYSSSTASGNVAVGYQTLQNNSAGTNNAAFGYQALQYNTAASDNTAVGYYALNRATGLSLTAVGSNALAKNTSGVMNTAVGATALFTNTTGANNTAVGYQALNKSINSSDNAAFGYNALYSNTAGSANTAVGRSALENAQTMSENTAVGYQALQNIRAGYAYSTAVGYRALATANNGGFNTAVGWAALEKTTTGTNNTAVGQAAGANNTTGGSNTAVGMEALAANTTGGDNTGVGRGALNRNTTGCCNTATGHAALEENTTGGFNVATGSGALQYNVSGNNNVGIGYQAMISNASGSSNVALGIWALDHNTVGYDNVAIGPNAMTTNTSGHSNTVIGVNADVSAPDLFNATALGAGAQVTGSNRIVLGDGNVSAIYANVTSITAISDRRLKRDIGEIGLGLDFLRKLRPVEYRFNNSDDTLRYGFIAQELESALPTPLQKKVEAAAPEQGLALLSRQEDKQRTYRLSYGELTAPLVKAVQELAASDDRTTTQLRDDIAALKRDIAQLREAQRSCAAAK